MSERNAARDALILKTCDKINKQLKSNVAFTLSKAFKPENVKTFAPTGNLAADFVIGKPGFPVGRITEIAGPFSSGKCLVEGTKISMNDGTIKNIEDVCVGDKLRSPNFRDNENKIEFDVVKKVINSGKQQVYKIVLNNGLTITATENHQFLSLSNIEYAFSEDVPLDLLETKLPWTHVGQLKEKDFLCVDESIYTQYWDNFIYKFDYLKEEVIEVIIGLFTKLRHQYDKNILTDLFKYSNIEIMYGLGAFVLLSESVHFVFNNDIPELRMYEKQSPNIDKNEKSFVTSLTYLFHMKLGVSTRIYNKKNVFICIRNPYIIHQIISAGKKYIEKNDIYVENLDKYQGVFRFYEEFVKEHPYTDVKYRYTNWKSISSITCVGEKNTWDLSMTERDYFVANGIVSHNSTIAAMSIGESQKAGMVTILIDTEHSYDSSWAERYGVDPELLILLQPKHVEQIFDYTHYLLEVLNEEKDSGVPILTVVDSISAISTSAELEQEDSTAGKQRAAHAKALSEGLRKLGNEIWDRNMALVFISQLKDNPGMMYGKGQSKLGGSAIDFHAALLLETHVLLRKKINNIKCGQVVKVVSKKNKFVPPFREANFYINYMTGVDNRETALNFMLSLGWLKKEKGFIINEKGEKVKKSEILETISPDMIVKLYDYLGITNEANKQNGNNLTYNLNNTGSDGLEEDND